MTRDTRQEAGQGEVESLARLLWRYVWPFACFRDASRGTALERRAAYRHNRAMRVHLPGFMLRWSTLGAIAYAAGAFLEGTLTWVLPAACCYVAGSVAVPMVATLAFAWMWLSGVERCA